MNLGLDPFLIAQALSGVVSQRLVARVCQRCAEERKPEEDILAAVGIRPHEATEICFMKGRGCRTCHGRGYLGRIAIYEVMLIDDSMRTLIMRGAPETEIQQAAEAHGMRSLRDAALAAVRAGITTPEEMGRVVLVKES
jgi:type II secretory ATPase GspE/PulE/Tfp pilus assembly ATPase PilB-like protein